MLLFDREYRKQRRKARIALEEYRKNGWQSPWIKRNTWLEVLRR